MSQPPLKQSSDQQPQQQPQKIAKNITLFSQPVSVSLNLQNLQSKNFSNVGTSSLSQQDILDSTYLYAPRDRKDSLEIYGKIAQVNQVQAAAQDGNHDKTHLNDIPEEPEIIADASANKTSAAQQAHSM